MGRPKYAGLFEQRVEIPRVVGRTEIEPHHTIAKHPMATTLRSYGHAVIDEEFGRALWGSKESV